MAENLISIELPEHVVTAIEKYRSSSFESGSIGALNLVAFIGEQVVAAYEAKKAEEAKHCEDKHCELRRGHGGAHQMGIRVRGPRG